MQKGWIVWVALVIILLVVAYVYTGFHFKLPGSKSTTTLPTTTTVAASSNTPPTSTIPPGFSTNCANVYIQGVKPYANSTENCTWAGGKLGVWVQAGKAFNTTIQIVGQDGLTFLQGGFNYQNLTFYSNVSLPAQNYSVTLSAGPESGIGGAPFVKLNLTTTPPAIVYSTILNANFSNGQYTGWNISGAGFGTKPFNITYANANGCYKGSRWAGYEGGFFATTYNCGTSVAPGNLTSVEFRVDPKTPFLNFRIVSPDDSLIYVEAYQVGGNGTVVGRYNTFNISLSPNASSTFQNVSLPLTTLTNKVVRLKIVATTVQPGRYMAIGDFAMAGLPNSQKGVSEQINITR